MFAQNAAKQVKVNGFGNAAVKAGLAIRFVKVAVAAERQYRQMRVTLFDLPATALSILSTQPVADRDHMRLRFFDQLHEVRAGENDFIGMVSHELKTPLTSLTAIVQVANQKLKNSEDAFLAGAMKKLVFR